MDNITYDFIDIEIPDFGSEFFSLWLNEVARQEGSEIEFLGYVFCSDEDLKEMNKDYLDHDYFTDVITFGYNEGVSLNGEVFISYDRVKDNAVKFGNGSVYDELCRVMVHGLLHLIGYKDKTEEESELMRKKEEMSLKLRNGFT